MKISLITVTYNAEEFIHECVQSVVNQTYGNIEHIIIDGNSSDHTISIIHNFRSAATRIISEPDKGIYDAMNKGIALATGDIIGILNADDFFPNPYVLEKIAHTFEEKNSQIVYGNLWFIDRKLPHKLVRKWKSSRYRKNLFQWGWMPAHPTFYVRKELFAQFGNYNEKFRCAADYELMLRFLHTCQASAFYIDELLVVMRTGGISNKSLGNVISANWNALKAMHANHIPVPLLSFFLKPARKIFQYLFRPEYFRSPSGCPAEALTRDGLFSPLLNGDLAATS
jgi:glycosyltransferase involved in cell wall biosynthesis